TLAISSTTGFAILDNALWPDWMSIMLVCVGIVCGCSGSTSSGIKVDRLLILFKSIGRYVNNILHPYSVNEVRLGKHILRDDEVSPHLLY
ncbi:MAG TPA: potassium transporter KefA, partial [Rikenellaceae bacterium]|nr:potassium transporter KefA [Rikenellaceae bacterium]